MAQKIAVPDIGDFKDVEVIEILVKPGDKVIKNDPIVTIESDKSSVEIPSPSDGEIKDLKVKIGDKVSEGSILAIIENGLTSAKKKVVEKTRNAPTTCFGIPVKNIKIARSGMPIRELRGFGSIIFHQKSHATIRKLTC